MKITISKRKYIFVLVLSFLFILSLPFLFSQSIEKAVFLIISFLIWLLISFFTKSLSLSSLLYILIVLPFNITLQLPTGVVILGSEFVLSSPFVNGVLVNYLVPTLSILDLGVFLFLSSVLVEKGFKSYLSLIKDFKNAFLFLSIYLFIQNFFIQSFLSGFMSLRVLLYTLAFLLVIELLKKKDLVKIFTPVTILFLINTFIQGIVGILQFKQGSSLGLTFLGESQVVSGMTGSSFVELFGELYLRAYGTFSHPNILAGYFLLGIFFGIFCLKRHRLLGSLLILSSSIFLLFTFSRITILLAVLVLIVCLIKYVTTMKNHMFSSIPLLFVERLSLLFKGGDHSWVDRVNLFKSSMRVINENFLFGTGLGNFVKGMELFVPRTSNGVLLLQPVHNVFVLIFAEMGIGGFLLYLYLIVRVVLKRMKKFTVLNVLMIFCLIFISMFDHFPFSLPQGMVIAGVLLLLVIWDLEALYEDEKDVYKD